MAAQSLDLTTPAAELRPDPKPSRPWGVRSWHVRYGPERVFYQPSDIHVQQPGHGTSVTLHGVKAEDRTSFEYFYTMPNGWPQLDEPQTTMGVATQFNNGFGAELNLKHNKYVVQDKGQEVRFEGTMVGQAVDEPRPLGSYVGQYEISGGLNQVALMGSYAVPLPALRAKDRFSLVTKAGPNVLVTYTNSWLRSPSGELELGPQRYHLGGYGAVAENELRYEINRGLSVGIAHSVSFANVTRSEVAGGHAHHGIWMNHFAGTLGYTFNRKPKAEDPVEP